MRKGSVVGVRWTLAVPPTAALLHSMQSAADKARTQKLGTRAKWALHRRRGLQLR
jgi:hypothetical protein